jgi:hypothetical protein
MITINFPAMAGRCPTAMPAASAAPAEIPTGRPSRRAASRAVSIALSLLTVTTSSITLRSRIAGTKPAPMPWILCGAGWPPDSTGDAAGSTAIARKSGLRALSTWPTPVIVPPVPTPATSASMRPAVSCHSSSAVVRRWISGLAGFSNCCGIKASGSDATISSALRIAPFMPSDAGVSTSSAPSSRSMRRRSIDMLSGMVRIRR